MRVVSLCPSLTELVFDLGRGGDLVGITQWCVHPADKVSKVETVGGTKDPNLARILELRPDLVLMNDEENRIEDAEALQAFGIEILSSLPRSAGETAAMVRSIAAALDSRAAGESIACEIELRAQKVAAAAADAPPVSFAYLIWKAPWVTVSADTYASALLEQAGGRNVFPAAGNRYPRFELAELKNLDPRLVLLCSEPYPFSAKDARELAECLGIEAARVVQADGEYLSWHGSRTPDGIDYAAKLIDRART